MTDLQLQQLYLGVLCLITSAALAACALRVRHKTRRPEVIGLAALMGLVAGLSFLLDSYATKQGHESWVWALVDSLEISPVAFTIAYACRVQSRRYQAARYRPKLRKLMGKAPYALGALWAVSTALKIVAPYPSLADAYLPAPPRALLFEGVILVGNFFFAVLAAFVFLAAARTESPGAKARLQNLSAGVAMCLFAFESVLSIVFWTALIQEPGEQVGFVTSTMMNIMGPLIVLELVSLFVAVTAYYSRADADKLTERMVDFFGYGVRISEALANAPVWKRGLSIPYTCLLQAGRKEYLDLSPKEQQQADEAYRLTAILKHGREGGTFRSGVITGDELIDLAKLYDELSRDPELTSLLPSPNRCCGIGGARTGTVREAGADVRVVSLYGTFKVLRPILAGEDARPLSAWAPTEGWAQLVCVALAEAGLLSSAKRAAVLEGRAVPQRIKDGYDLARAMVSSGTI